MTSYRMGGKVYTEDEIRSAIADDLIDIATSYTNEGGTPPPNLNVEDYLTESVHAGTIECLDDDM